MVALCYLHQGCFFFFIHRGFIPFGSDGVKGFFRGTRLMCPLNNLLRPVRNSGTSLNCSNTRRGFGLDKTGSFEGLARAQPSSARKEPPPCINNALTIILANNCILNNKLRLEGSSGIFIGGFRQFRAYVLRVADSLVQPLISKHGSHCSRNGTNKIGANSSIESPPSFFL